MKTTVTLYNSLSKKKETLQTHTPGVVSLYVCGITPYDYAHLGHGRCYVSFDILVRLLLFIDLDVQYIRNFTDIDDKIIKRAAQAQPPVLPATISKKFISAYHNDMEQLGCLKPTVEPCVTEHIQEIIAMIETLIAQGHAYVIERDVYFDIQSFPSYGKLSGKKLDDLIAGSRIEVDNRKKNPGDFALWKSCEDNEYWKSPWGYGRPGWHIECSAMAQKYLGDSIDIHAGGMDLQFPHHENEIAQSEGATGKPFATYWLHNAFINVNNEKMSKSLGNFVTLKDAFETIHPMILRYYYVQHHYRTPLDFQASEITAIATAYKRLVALAQLTNKNNATVTAEILTKNPISKLMLDALCDDLNTPKLLGVIFEYYAAIKQDSALLENTVFILQNLLGLSLKPLPEATTAISEEIQQLITLRDEARHNKDWSKADQIREKLKELGYIPIDKK